jgi:2-polyprenyl-6-methoxyphenol hydroxylase-like FAD-dependent oxidoreductase
MPNETDIDVIVGGAGVAGTAAAASIQQLGYSVLLVEPGLNDDRRLAGEVFHPPGVSGLAELGLLNALMEKPAVTVNGFTVTSGKEYIRLPYDSVLAHQMPGLSLEHRLIRRRLLDLVGGLPNVILKHGARVVHIDQSDSSGLVVRLAEGKNAQDYRCRMLVAADGAQSRIGRMAGIKVHSRRISTILSYRVGAESLPQRDYGHVFLGRGTPILLYPIATDEARILFDIPYDSGRRPDASDCLAMTAAALPPVLRRAVEDAVAAQPKLMTVLTHASATDRSVAGRVALVGDAGGSCHPLTASGMTMCINDALLLRRRALSERPDRLPEALALYQQRRRWPQATRLALAEALRDAFCGTSPELRVVQNGILAYWRDNAAGRAATLALLSTADGRPFALLRQFVAVMIRGFIEHLHERSDCRAGTWCERSSPPWRGRSARWDSFPRAQNPTAANGRVSGANAPSVHSRNDATRNHRTVRFPVLAIAHGAHGMVAPLAVHEQDREIEDVKIRQRALEEAGQAPGETHQQVAEIVHVAREAPPAGGEQQRTLRRGDEFRRSSPDRPIGIATKAMLMQVGAAENHIARDVEQHDCGRAPERQFVGVFDEIIGLDRIGERHPDEVAPAEHPAEIFVLTSQVVRIASSCRK